MRQESEHDREIRALFQQVPRSPAPPFRRLWSSAREQAQPRARLRRRAFGVVATAAAVVLLWAVIGIRDSNPGDRLSEELLAQTHWNGPLDFLLETPGDELLRTTPRFSVDVSILPNDLSHLQQRSSEHDQ